MSWIFVCHAFDRDSECFMLGGYVTKVLKDIRKAAEWLISHVDVPLIICSLAIWPRYGACLIDVIWSTPSW